MARLPDAATFVPTEKYNLWHDRAVFHFLTDKEKWESYINAIKQGLKKGGTLVIATFSEQGPKKCSGIEIKQYSEQSLQEQLGTSFQKINSITIDHTTPFNTVQNFLFCSFRYS